MSENVLTRTSIEFGIIRDQMSASGAVTLPPAMHPRRSNRIIMSVSVRPSVGYCFPEMSTLRNIVLHYIIFIIPLVRITSYDLIY